MQGCGYYEIETKKIHQKWHHTCLSLKTEFVTQDETHVKTKMYFDGTDVKKGIVVYVSVFLV